MPTFPTLTTPPNYPLKEIIDDGSIKNVSEAGYITTRRKYTHQNISYAEISYTMLTDTDKEALRTFYDTVENVDTFEWTHPYTDVVYTVRFDTVPTFELMDNNKWSVNFALRTA